MSMNRRDIVYAFTGSHEVKVGDIVYHQLSKLLFKCENNKHERWMNMNEFYQKTNLNKIDYEQFEKSSSHSG